MYRLHVFSYEWFGTKTRFARGKSQLFIHELLREPLINICHKYSCHKINIYKKNIWLLKLKRSASRVTNTCRNKVEYRFSEPLRGTEIG